MPKDNRTPKPHPVFTEAVDQHLKRERELIEQFRLHFGGRKQAMLTQAEIYELSSVLQDARTLYDANFARSKEHSAAHGEVGVVIRPTIRKQLLKTVQSARKMASLNRANIVHLEKLFHGPGDTVFDSDLNIDLEAATEELLEYEQFEPPYDFSDTDTLDGDFSYNGSYALHRWGIFGNNIDFVHKHDHGDIDLSFESSQKYAVTTAGVGKNYHMPRTGVLDISLVVRSLSNDVTFEIEDYFGPSDSYLNFENIFFVQVSGQSSGYLHSAFIIEETKRSNGDDKTGSLSTIQPDQLFVLNFRTSDSFEQGDDIKILLVSYLRVLSYAYLMQNKISATLNWHLEKIFLKIV